MNKLKAVLRLSAQWLSQRQIAASCTLGQATVSDYLTRARAAGLGYEDISDWPDEQLLAALGAPDPGPIAQKRTSAVRCPHGSEAKVLPRFPPPPKPGHTISK